MHLVNQNDIPRLDEIIDTPLDNPLQLLKTCIEMQEICEKENGVGLSAVQVGLPWKLFIIKAAPGSEFETPNRYGFFINCEYEPLTNAENFISIEGCLSIKTEKGKIRHFEVNRYNNIRVFGKKMIVYQGINIQDTSFGCNIRGQSIVFQHEIDHHHAVLISDIGKEITYPREIYDIGKE